MLAVLDEPQVTDLVATIPGLAALGAAAILAQTGDLTRFASARAGPCWPPGFWLARLLAGPSYVPEERRKTASRTRTRMGIRPLTAAMWSPRRVQKVSLRGRWA